MGFTLALTGAAALVQKFGAGLVPSPPVGGGGYLGALAIAFLEGQFGPVGMLLILLAAGLVGLALCYDTLVLWPVQVILRARRPGPAADEAAGDPAPESSLLLPQASFELVETSPRPVPIASRPVISRPPENGEVPTSRSLQPSATPQGGGVASAGPPGALTGRDYELPALDLLEPPVPFPIHEHEAKIHARAMLLERTLLDFGLQVRVVQIDTGPVITQLEIALEAGLSVKRINSLADDLAIALAVPSVRIVAPIPGKTTIGIEVPNERRGIVKLGEVIQAVDARAGKFKIPLFLGKDVKGNPLAFDLADMPHLLIAGRTGTGKSVCLNAMILSILMTKSPDEVKLILIDPKVVELSDYKRIPHLMHPVVTDMKKAESLLAWACDKMDERVRLPRPRGRPQHPVIQPARRRGDLRAAPPRGRAGAGADPDLHALHRDHRRRGGRPDDDRRQGGRIAHRPPGAEGSRRGHAPDRRHPEADGGRHHRSDQGQHAGADRLPGDQPRRLAGHPRRDGGRQASGYRRYALPHPRAPRTSSAPRARSSPTARSTASATTWSATPWSSAAN